MTAIARACERLRVASALVRGRAMARLWALRGARIGTKSSIGRQCAVDRPWHVELGTRVVLEPDVYLKLAADDAALGLGDFVFVGRGSQFDVHSRVTVGAHTVIAPRCFITDHNHGTRRSLRIDQQPGTVKPVDIGSDVWLGTGVVVLPGVRIGDGAVVGAHSVVSKDVAPMSVVAGVPARFVRMREEEGNDD